MKTIRGTVAKVFHIGLSISPSVFGFDQ